ncbi:uncharacterized protein LOC8286744 isoform X2 [Ricinus communis]|uniref:uncharacterized protein LOC8286744 isoform X2 n=1 Tax=Ricinus communis TaxID=3988 RepID=UPI0007725233|nr:uncharacterized protein LOC8286744 isoform X2 [Ricinus communis]XP_048226553.1 uncharacterized protein LOC8286744 isoform X2 [Ricinus communis]|eukprot:XP_002511978.2 uncharacterized protein LOC8286744 isoform X2 [Ricinus communis]
MFQSSNNGNVDPIYYNDQQELQDHDFILHQSHDLLPHQQQQPLRDTAADAAISTTTTTATTNMANSKRINDADNELTKICNRESHHSTTCNQQHVFPRKRSSKRDRHSKIDTAQGPRDRRMRLSLKVAREFFDLQDKLCFDKASKTVEWLLIQSRPAIRKLFSTGLPSYSCSVGVAKSASSTSECEDVSGIDEAAVANIEGSKNSKGKKPSLSCVNKKKRPKASRKTAFHPLAKESREKARARARQRTEEKKRTRRIIDVPNLCQEAKDQELNQLRTWSPFETTGEESGTQSHTMNNNPSMEMLAEIEEAPISSHVQQQDQLVTTEGMIDDSLVIMGKWSPSFIINHLFNTSIPQETNHQITDLQSFCKSWEVAYNS